MARESVATERPTASSYMKFHDNDSMLPSKMMPTTSPLLLINGLPELPPMMSGVETVSYTVFRSREDLAFSQLSGSWYGGLLPCSWVCWKAPPRVVNHGTFFPSSLYPFTAP